MLFLADVMALQLDVRAPFEDARDLVHRGVIGASEATQALGILLDQLPVVTRLPFGMGEGTGGEEPAEVFVALTRLDEEGEAGRPIETLLPRVRGRRCRRRMR